MKKIFLLLLLFVGIVSGNSDASPLFMAASGRSNVSPSIYYNFLTGTLPTPLTFTRASSGWYYNSSGILTQAANNVPRFDYNPLTLALNGLLIEQQSTNLVKNNSMVGAVVGTMLV